MSWTLGQWKYSQLHGTKLGEVCDGKCSYCIRTKARDCISWNCEGRMHLTTIEERRYLFFTKKVKYFICSSCGLRMIGE